MAQVITKEDFDNLVIDKERAGEMTLSEMLGTTFDTRNGLQSRKWEAVSRSNSQSYTETSRSLSQSYSDVTRS